MFSKSRNALKHRSKVQHHFEKLLLYQLLNSQNYCCINPPLLNTELDHVVLDKLHLLLWIMDVLLNNLVKDALNWDKRYN